MLRSIVCVCTSLLAGCYACSRHVSSTRPDTVRPCAGLTEKYRLSALTVKHPTFGSDQKCHEEDEKRIFETVLNSLINNYPEVFSNSCDAIPLSVHIDWGTRYQGSPILQSIITYLVVPETAEQETDYRVRVSAGEVGSSAHWEESASAARFSETWETWLLPVGFIPIPGRSDWPRTFCFLRLQKDSIVGTPQDTIKSKNCIRHLVFDPKVDGDVLAATIMRAVNRQSNSQYILGLMKEGGVE